MDIRSGRLHGARDCRGNTIRKYLRSDEVEPRFQVPDRPSKLDAYVEQLLVPVLRPGDIVIENGGAKLDHDSGGEVLLRAA